MNLTQSTSSSGQMKDMLSELNRKVKGNDRAKKLMICALMADLALLLHATPGTAKTLSAATLARMIEGARFGRIQGTPDLTPSDITGVEYLDRKTSDWKIKRGLIIDREIVLGDEINRIRPITLSAMLAALAERQVDVFGERIWLADPFFFISTMNPIESEGVFPLPEAFYDRMGLQLNFSYMSREAEMLVLSDVMLHGRDATSDIRHVASLEDVRRMRKEVDALVASASPALTRYATDICRATRPGLKQGSAGATQEDNELYDNFERVHGSSAQSLRQAVAVGSSTRGGICMLRAGAALALFEEDVHLTPDHIKFVASDALRHRIVLRPEASYTGVSTDVVIDQVMRNVPVAG